MVLTPQVDFNHARIGLDFLEGSLGKDAAFVQDGDLAAELLDEPVAGMTDEETVRTAELFLSLKGKHSLMVVEHDMSFIRTISEIVTVLCDGSVLAQGTLDQVQADERVIEVYLGR